MVGAALATVDKLTIKTQDDFLLNCIALVFKLSDPNGCTTDR